MSRRLLVILLIAVAIGAISIATVSKATTSDRKGFLNVPQPQAAGFIDGSVNPELIPDQVAYALVFRLLSDRHTEEQKSRALSYLRIVFGCSDCGSQEALESEKHINDLLFDRETFRASCRMF